MEHREIEQEQVIERYVAGTLSAEQVERFEEHYLDCQQCLDELELAEALREGIRQVAVEEGVKAAIVQQAGIAAWLSRSPWAKLMLGAVVLLALLPLTWYLARSAGGGGTVEVADALAPQENTLILGLSPERGGPGDAPSAQVRLPSKPGWIVFSLELTAPEHPAYEARLLDANGTTLWTGQELVPNHQDSLTISLHSSTLTPGDYRFEVEGLSEGQGAQPEGSFAFRVLASGD